MYRTHLRKSLDNMAESIAEQEHYGPLSCLRLAASGETQPWTHASLEAGGRRTEGRADPLGLITRQQRS